VQTLQDHDTVIDVIDAAVVRTEKVFRREKHSSYQIMIELQ